jgi:hypothetical protein
MKHTDTRSMRQAIAALLLGLLGALPGSAAAQTPPAQPPAAEATADAFKFTSDAALIMWQVQPDKTADFELVWRVIRQRVDTAAGAEVRALVAGIRIYAPDFTAGDARTYVFHVDPVVKTSSYSPTFLLYESKLFERAEADELFAKMSGALMPGNAISTMPLRRTP